MCLCVASRLGLAECAPGHLLFPRGSTILFARIVLSGQQELLSMRRNPDVKGWRPGRESNSHLSLRRTLFYPLNYQDGRALYISPCGLLLELPSDFLQVEKHSEEFCRMRKNSN